MNTDILVTGGGASGVCAAIQAARLGKQVVLVSEVDWLGGMLTAAGVSATDGNHHLPSGIWGEFRSKIYDHYGGPEAVATGWVSNTQFEPHVGNKIFHDMVGAESSLIVLKNYWITEAVLSNKQVTGARFTNLKGEQLIIEAQISIDATEYGDLLALAGCDFALGRESEKQTGEKWAPDRPDKFIQDLTYVAVLKDYGTDHSHLIPKPAKYNPVEFMNCCADWSDGGTKLVDKHKMLEYGRLPNDKFMINWPINGNDFYINNVNQSYSVRINQFEAAKQRTLEFVYFIQNELGFKNLGLADDEFPAEDKLALIPYIRESRRLRGLATLTVNDLVNPSDSDLYKQGIAVGDYPLDHHHLKAGPDVHETFPDIPSFSVPFGALVPQKIKGLLVAEKSISATHLANGCTRLQPVVMQIGQAAGAAAALCVDHDLQPPDLNIRELQEILLGVHCWIMPYVDMRPGDQYFESVQRIGAAGWMKGEGRAKDWANEFRFHPDEKLSTDDLLENLGNISRLKLTNEETDSLRGTIHPSKRQVLKALHSMLMPDQAAPTDKMVILFLKNNAKLSSWYSAHHLDLDEMITRAEFAFLVDHFFRPFKHPLRLI